MMSEGLVDLSLFSYSPTDDRHFTVTEWSDTADGLDHTSTQPDEPSQPTREFYAPRSVSHSVDERLQFRASSRPLPSAICGRIIIPDSHKTGGNQLSNGTKRKRTAEWLDKSDLNISRRRNVATPPQLLLSSPTPSRNNEGPTSELVWMPEEQMWLVVGEGERSHEEMSFSHGPSQRHTSTPNRTRSAPTTRTPSHFNETPPLSPIQWQLRSLIAPQDEERLTPLFQDAINSIPIETTLDGLSPSLSDLDRRESSFSADPSVWTRAFPKPIAPQDRSHETFHPRFTLTRAASYGTQYITAPAPSVGYGSNLGANLSNPSRPRSDVGALNKSTSSTFPCNWTSQKSWSAEYPRIDQVPIQGPNVNSLHRGRSNNRSWIGWAKKFTRPRSTT